MKKRILFFLGPFLLLTGIGGFVYSAKKSFAGREVPSLTLPRESPPPIADSSPTKPTSETPVASSTPKIHQVARVVNRRRLPSQGPTITPVAAAPTPEETTVSHPSPTPNPMPTPTTPTPVLVPTSLPTPSACPTLSVSCPADVEQGAPIRFKATASSTANLSYNWSLSAGAVSGGQGTPSLTVNTDGLGGQAVTATVEFHGPDISCSGTVSCTTGIRPPGPQALKFDEYGNIHFDDEKARLDNYAIQLQNYPDAEGYVIAYGVCEGEAQQRADRAKDYLVNTRVIDAGRVVTVDGGCRDDLLVDLWVVPAGATAPVADTENINLPCPVCRLNRPGRRHTRGNRGGSEPVAFSRPLPLPTPIPISTPRPSLTPPPTSTPTATPATMTEPPISVEVSLPKPMQVGDRGRVTVILIRAPGRIRATFTPADGESTTVETPAPLPIGTPGSSLELRLGEGYDACARGRLSAPDFDFKNEVGECKPLDFPVDLSWEWSITAQQPNQQSSVTPSIEILWRNKQTKRDDAQVELWKHDGHVQVSQRVFLIGQVYIVPTLFSVLGGGVTLLTLYDRLKARRDKKGLSKSDSAPASGKG
jgi:hypothetical protein